MFRSSTVIGDVREVIHGIEFVNRLKIKTNDSRTDCPGCLITVTYGCVIRYVLGMCSGTCSEAFSVISGCAWASSQDVRGLRLVLSWVMIYLHSCYSRGV